MRGRLSFCDLFNAAADAQKTAWTEEQRVLYTQGVGPGTGRGELATRHSMGFDLVAAGYEHGDLPNGEEVKDLNSGEKTQSEVPDLGKLGKVPCMTISGALSAAIALQRTLQKLGVFDQRIEQFRSFHETLHDGELSVVQFREFLSLAPEYNAYVNPENVITFPAIHLTTDYGRLRVPAADYVRAFKPIRITKGSLRYKVRYDYLESVVRMQHTSKKRIGLIAGSFKPYHAGHHELVKLAASENDEVILYASLVDRARKGEFVVRGEAMARIWDEQLTRVLPKNVKLVAAASSPITSMWEQLGTASENLEIDVYSVYADPDDAAKIFTENNFRKYSGNLWKNDQIIVRSISRETTGGSVSGTKLRQFLKKSDFSNFAKFLPEGTDAQAIWDILRENTGISPV